LNFLFFILLGGLKSTATFIFCIVCIVENSSVSFPNELPRPSGRQSETVPSSKRHAGNSVSESQVSYLLKARIENVYCSPT
jgi:hypothetical protein